MCYLLEVGRNSYYEWLERQPSARQLERQFLAKRVKEIFMESRCSYGSRRVRKILQSEGIVFSRRRVGKLMKSQGLGCKTKRKFKNTTDSKHRLPISDNHLDRDFTVQGPNQKYVGDITYIWTHEGWLYL